jgi:hypothetical protein
MEEKSNTPNNENYENIKEYNFLDEKDKLEIIKIDDRIKVVENEMNQLISKIEKTEIEKENIYSRFDDVGKEGIKLEQKYFDLKNKLDIIKPETEEEKNIRLKDKIEEIEKISKEIDNFQKEHDAIIISDMIQKPSNKSKFIMDKYDKDVAYREEMKNNKTKLSNLLNSRNQRCENLKDELNKLKNQGSIYDIVLNDCKVAYDEYNKITDVYNSIKKEINEIEKIISKDKFNGTILYDETIKLDKIKLGIINKGVFCLTFNHISGKTTVSEYDQEGNKIILFNDLSDEIENRNNQFKKLEELEENPPTYVYTVVDIILEIERESLKALLSYELVNYNNFIDSSDPEYNRINKDLIKKEIINLRKKIKEIEKKINDSPKHEWTEVDKNALEIEKNKIISSMSERTKSIYLNEEKKKEIDKKNKLIQIENENFKNYNYSKNQFKNYLDSIGALKENSNMKNIAMNILKKMDY